MNDKHEYTILYDSTILIDGVIYDTIINMMVCFISSNVAQNINMSVILFSIVSF